MSLRFLGNLKLIGFKCVFLIAAVLSGASNAEQYDAQVLRHISSSCSNLSGIYAALENPIFDGACDKPRAVNDHVLYVTNSHGTSDGRYCSLIPCSRCRSEDHEYLGSDGGLPQCESDPDGRTEPKIQVDANTCSGNPIEFVQGTKCCAPRSNHTLSQVIRHSIWHYIRLIPTLTS